MRNLLLAALLTAALLPASARAQSALFGIAEGVAEQASFGELQEKYQPLADHLGKVLKRRIVLESSQNIPSALSNLAKQRYDLMFIRPSNVTGRALRDQQYQLVAMAKGEFAANFIVRKDHGFKKPEDVFTRTIAMPEESALMSRVGLATLRDLGASRDKLQIRYTRYQEAVGYMVEQKFADVGVVSPAQAKAWEKKGGAVLFKSKKLPFWAVIASPKITKEEVVRMQKTLLEMENNPEGQAILQKIGVKGWAAGNPQDYLDLLNWLGV